MTCRIRIAPAVLPALAVVAGACAIPPHDNPFDPNNAPTAGLRILDRTAPDGLSCLATGSNLVSVSTRSRCLLLDASGSTDPQGSSLQYVFSVSTTANPSASNDSLFSQITAAPLVSPALVLESNGTGLLSSLPVSVPITFRVQVLDDHNGHREPALASLVLLNSRPIARPDAARGVPLGGYPWTAGYGLPTVMRFHGSASRDPDGDPIVSWCWTFTSTTSAAISGPICSKDVDWALPVSARGRIEARLTVSDGKLESLPATTIVAIGDRAPWTGDSSVQRFERMDRHAGELFASASAPTEAVFVPDASGGAVVLGQSGGAGYELRAARWPDFVPASAPFTALPASDARTLVADPGNGRFWLIESSSPSLAHLYSVSGTTITAVPGFVPKSVGLDSNGIQLSFAVGSDGTLYGAQLGASSLWVVPPDQTTQAFVAALATPGRMLASIALRPGTDELWAVELPNFIATTSGQASGAVLRRLLPPSTESWPLGESAFGLRWVDAHQAWTTLSDFGLSRIDVDSLIGGLPLSASLVENFPSQSFGGSLDTIVDEASGDLWISSSPSVQITHVTTDGRVLPYTSGGDVRPLFVDPESVLWYTVIDSSYTLHLMKGDSADPGVVVSSFDGVTGFQGFASDPSTGGLWLSTIIPGAIERRGLDGAVENTYGSASGSPIPILLEVRAAPDGGSLWGSPVTVSTSGIISPHGYFRYVFDDTGATSAPVLDTAATYDLLATDLIEPSAPVPSSTPFAWAVAQSTKQLVLVHADGSGETARATLPAAEFSGGGDRIVGALTTRSNDLCVATLDHSSTTLLVRLVPPAGSSLPAPVLSLPLSGFPDVAIDDASDASADRCWVAFSVNGDLSVYELRSGASPIQRSHVFVGEGLVTSIFGESSDEVWMTVERGNEHESMRVRFSGASFKDATTFPNPRRLEFSRLMTPLN